MVRCLTIFETEITSEVYGYCQDCGSFYRNGRKVGSASLSAGYVQVCLPGGKPVLGHRLAYFIVTGDWPDGCIDHINHDRADNRWENLRVIRKSENAKNMRLRHDNKFGCPGIRRTKSSKFAVEIAGKWRGVFDSLEEAISHRRKCEADLGFHPNHGT